MVRLGGRALSIVDELGRFSLLGIDTVRVAFRRRFPLQEVLVQFESIAVRSVSIVAVTALFTGMVLALRRPHSGPGYSRLATSDDNDDFALADDLLAADADDVEPSDI